MWCWQTLESSFDCKEIQLVNPKGNQSWLFIRRTEAETPVLWSPHEKSWLIGKDSDAGRDWGLEEEGTTEDEMAGWHHWLDGCESGWTLGVGDGQGGLACCDSRGRKESDTTERLNGEWEDYGAISILFCILYRPTPVPSTSEEFLKGLLNGTQLNLWVEFWKPMPILWFSWQIFFQLTLSTLGYSIRPLQTRKSGNQAGGMKRKTREVHVYALVKLLF